MPQLPADHLPVPLVRQATMYSCGPATLLAIAQYYRVFEGTESALYERLETSPVDGTHPKMLLEGAESLGLSAVWHMPMSTQMLRDCVRRGHPAIVNLQAWRKNPQSELPWMERWEDGHYVVAVAMTDDHLFVMDPSVPAAYGYLPIAELEARWHDYESRDGVREVHERLAIEIWGEAPIDRYPAAPVRMR